MTDNIIKKLVSLGCLKFNINGTEMFPTNIINQGNGYVLIDGQSYNSNSTVELISIDVKKLKNIFESLKFIIKFDKDIDVMSFSEAMSIGILQQMDKMDNDIDRITHLKTIINYGFKDLIDTTPIIMEQDELEAEEAVPDNMDMEVEYDTEEADININAADIVERLR